MRRMRGVRLVLVDERGRSVDRTMRVVRGPQYAVNTRPSMVAAGEDHEVSLVAAIGDVVRTVRVIERVIGHEEE